MDLSVPLTPEKVGVMLATGILGGAVSPEPTLPPYIGPIASGAYIPTAATASNQQSSTRTRHFACQDITSMRVVYGAWSVTADTDGSIVPSTAALNIEVHPEYAGVNLGAFGWSGGGVIASGSNGASQDKAVSIPKGAEFFLRPYITSAAAGVPYTTTGGGGTFDVGEVNAGAVSGLANSSGGVGTFTGTSTTSNIYPQAILGTTTKPTFFCYGTSRTIGSGGTPDAVGETGEFLIGMGIKYPAINAGVSSGRAYWDERYPNERLALAAHCSHIFIGPPVNDLRAIRANRTSAQVYGDVMNLAARHPGKVIITGTVTYAQLDAVTPDANWAQVDAYNALVLAAVADPTNPIQACIDYAAIFNGANGLLLDVNDMLNEGDRVHYSAQGRAKIVASGRIQPDVLAALQPVQQYWAPTAITERTNNRATVLSANDPATLGDPTYQWICSNNIYGWSHATPGNRPVLTPNAIGARAAYVFTAASSQHLAGSASTANMLRTATKTLFGAVVAPNNNGAIKTVYLQTINGSSASARLACYVLDTMALRISVRRADGDAVTSFTSTTILTAGQPYIITALVDCSGGKIYVWINGTLEVLGSGSDTLPSTGAYADTASDVTYIGRGGAAGQYFDGKLSDLVIIPRVAGFGDAAATTDARQRLEGHLAWTNGLTSQLDAANPYKAARPIASPLVGAL